MAAGRLRCGRRGNQSHLTVAEESEIVSFESFPGVELASIRDVAERAGVSVGTVSRVINGNSAVRPVLRSRVETAIRELGYRPNALAQSLRRQRSHTLGLVIPDITNPFFGELAMHIESAAAKSGYSLILCNSMNAREEEEVYVQTLADRRVDGLILVASAGTRTLPRPRRIPIVLADRELAGADLVASDHRGGAMLAVEHLTGLGHEVIACVAGPQDLSPAVQRYEGYAAVVTARFGAVGLDLADYVAFGSFDYQTGFEGAMALLRRRPRPTAIFASSDQQAIGALRACADLGLKVPGDISIVGFDDIPLAQLVKPRLTTVAQPISAIGELAVVRLLERAAALRRPRQRDLLLTTLKVRDSSAPAPRRRRRALDVAKSERKQVRTAKEVRDAKV